MVLLLAVWIILPGMAWAGGIGDVVTVVSKNFSNTEFEFGNEDRTGMNIKMHAAWGDIAGGYGAVTVLGPIASGQNSKLIQAVDLAAGSVGVKSIPLKGADVTEYTMSDGVGLLVNLSDFVITVEIYESGKGSSWDFQTARKIAQQTLDGLESSGILGRSAPQLDEKAPSEPEKQPEQKEPAAPAAETVSAKPLDEPVKVCDSNNIYGVYNGPTAPTTFTLDRPHLITQITNYHWNNAQGAAPGTIGLKDGSGKQYGPWQPGTRIGQGGVPNAYWDVFPNIVVPAGTYTIIDSDPGTWAQNDDSGGRGMSEVKATPNFEITGGSMDDLENSTDSAFPGQGSEYQETYAGVGSVGNIPGPGSTAEAVVGVAVPGAIAIVLGALAGLSGGGGLPAGGTPNIPASGGGSGGGSPSGQGVTGETAGVRTSQIGRRKGKGSSVSGIGRKGGARTGDGLPEIFIDTADMHEDLPSPTVQDTEGQPTIFIDTTEMFEDMPPLTVQDGLDQPDILIDTEEMGGLLIGEDGGPGDILIDTEEMGGPIIEQDGRQQDIFMEPEAELHPPGHPDIFIETEAELQEILSPEKVSIDTSATEEAAVSDAILYDRETGPQAGQKPLSQDEAPIFGKEQEPGIPESGQQGFRQEGFNKDGYDIEGFDREGFDAQGYDKAGFDRDGFDRKGFDQEGFDREGFDGNGFDREGYGRNGFDKNGYDREGFDVNGYNQKGNNRTGYDSKGYDAQGYDRDGFNKDGWDRDGYGRDGLNREGFDREGYNKDGFDKDGYDREGFDKNGRQREGFDADGYDKNGFNKDGYDRDGYDREGFDFEGYNRSGYDPWGYNKQGYGKDGYHWSGYNSEGYNRDGRHWSENPYEGDGNPFNVAAPDPFGGGEVIPFGTKWTPVKPKLGEPYPRTAEKYGPKPWTTEPEAAKPEVPKPNVPEDSGIIGPEDPMNTLKNHDLGGTSAPESGPTSLPIPEEDVPDGASSEMPLPSAGLPKHGDTIILKGGGDGKEYPLEYNEKTGEWENLLTGGKIRNEELESYKRDFERWQNDLGEDLRKSAQDLEKMAKGQDANSRAIKEALDKWKQLEQMEKSAREQGIGNKGGPGDVEKAIEDLKNDMLEGRELDQEKMDKIKKVIKGRIEGRTAEDTGERWEETPWYQDIDSALKANAATAKEVVTGEKEDGSISWLGMGARIMINVGTGGTAGVIMDGGLTVAEAMYRIKDSIDKGESDFQAVSKAIGLVVLGEEMGWVAGKAGGAIMGEMLERYPVFTNKLADLIETGALKIMKADQAGSAALGLITREGAEETIDQINKRLADITGDAGSEGLEQAARSAGKGSASATDSITSKAGRGAVDCPDVSRKPAAGAGDVPETPQKAGAGGGEGPNAPEKAGTVSGDGPGDPGGRPPGRDDAAAPEGTAPDEFLPPGSRSPEEVLSDPAAIARAEKTVQDNIKDFDGLPPARQQELVREQAIYDEYRLQAEERTWGVADKVQRGERITVEDALNMKADSASMRTMKDIRNVDGLGAELGEGGARRVQTQFNETLNREVYQPSYRDVRNHLSGRYNGAEIRVETVRTPGREYQPWDVNTDNDIVALRRVEGPNGPEWVEIPRSEWEEVYYKSFAQNTGFNADDAARRFPGENWNRMSEPDQYRRWAELHGESPTDVTHLEGARDFSHQRTVIMNGERPMIEATPQEMERAIETVNIDGRPMRPASPSELVQRGQGNLLDAEQLGMMEKYKVNHYWNEGSMRSQTEALEQLKKTADQARTMESGYRNMGYKVAEMPPGMEEAIRVINDRSLSPASRAAKIRNLGFETPGDLAEKLASRIGSLRTARRN